MPDPLYKYSIVVPVYNAESSIEALVFELYKHMASFNFEVVLVDDCSTDGSWAKMIGLYEEYDHLRIVRLSKNFGQSSATLCGIYRSKGEMIITIDDDLQYPPSEIPKLIKFFAAHSFYMVLGIPKKKKHPLPYMVFEPLIRLFFRLFQVGHLNGKRISSSFRIFRSDLNYSKDFPYGRVYSIHVATLMIDPLHIGEFEVEHQHSRVGPSRYSAINRLKGFFDLLIAYNMNPMSWAKWPLTILIASTVGLWSLGGYSLLDEYFPTLALFTGFILIIGQIVLATYLKRINGRQMGMGSYLVIEEHG